MKFANDLNAEAEPPHPRPRELADAEYRRLLAQLQEEARKAEQEVTRARAEAQACLSMGQLAAQSQPKFEATARKEQSKITQFFRRSRPLPAAVESPLAAARGLARAVSPWARTPEEHAMKEAKRQAKDRLDQAVRAEAAAQLKLGRARERYNRLLAFLASMFETESNRAAATPGAAASPGGASTPDSLQPRMLELEFPPSPLDPEVGGAGDSGEAAATPASASGPDGPPAHAESPGGGAGRGRGVIHR